MPVFAYSSLARGLLSGIVTKDSLKNREQLLDKVCNHAYCYENNFKRLERAEYLVKKKNIPIAQISLAYVINQPLNIFPIIGAANRDEIEADIGALDIELSQEEMAWLNLEDI